MAEVASAYVSLMPSAKGFGSKLDGQISGDIDKSGKRSGISFGKLFAAGAALGLGAKAFSFLGDSLGEASEAQVVGARTENVIKKMGGAAGISAKQVGDLAGAISAKTGIDDEAIQSGQNLLLTFGNVRNEAGKGNKIFNQASQLMVDMSSAMGTDAKGSAVQLGKALNDPVKGITALSRVGVSFTEQQKEQIAGFVESGDTMKAQKVILGELERQFGGAAETMATPADKAKVAFGNLQEQIGTVVLPIVEKLSDYFTTKIAPAVSRFIDEVKTGEGVGGRFADAFKKVADNLDTIVPVLATLVTGVAAYRAAALLSGAASAVMAAGTTGAAGATWSLNAALRANPIGIVVTALTLLAAGLVIAYKKSDTFRSIVDGALRVVGETGKWLWNNALKPAFEKMKDGFEAVGEAGTWLWNNALQPAFKFIVGGLASILDMWASMLSTLAKVPGFGWAEKAADAMANAADKARDVADGIKKIPPSKTVNITVAYKYTGLKSPTRGRDDEFGINPRGKASNGPKRAFNQVLKGYGETGENLMERIAKGIKLAKPKAVAAAQDAFDSLKSKMESKRDEIQSTVDGLKDIFEGIRSTVSEAFAGNLFDVGATAAKDAVTEMIGGKKVVTEAAVAARSVGQNFIDNLMGKKAQLTGLLASFNVLKGWGIDPKFLTQLFSSGNGALITELAGMGQAGAVDTANLFGEVTSLGSQLGSAVANNDPVAAEMVTANATLVEIRDALSYLSSDIGKELNQAGAKAQRNKKNRGKKGRGK